MSKNPLEKYLDAIENREPYIQPTISARLAQYILKALDYLQIHAQHTDNPSLIDVELQQEGEQAMLDIILEAPIPEEE